MKYLIDFLFWAGFVLLGYTWYPLLNDQSAEKCVSQSEWRQAPHEQQPEPMMATAGVSVERWVL